MGKYENKPNKLCFVFFVRKQAKKVNILNFQNKKLFFLAKHMKPDWKKNQTTTTDKTNQNKQWNNGYRIRFQLNQGILFQDRCCEKLFVKGKRSHRQGKRYVLCMLFNFNSHKKNSIVSNHLFPNIYYCFVLVNLLSCGWKICPTKNFFWNKKNFLPSSVSMSIFLTGVQTTNHSIIIITDERNIQRKRNN